MADPKGRRPVFGVRDWRQNHQRVGQLALTGEAGRSAAGTGSDRHLDYPQNRWLREAREVAQSVPATKIKSWKRDLVWWNSRGDDPTADCSGISWKEQRWLPSSKA